MTKKEMSKDEEEEKEEERAPQGEGRKDEEKKAPEGKEKKGAEGKDGPEEFETRTFRLAAPMFSKKSKEVVRATMEMLLRLRADGFHIGHMVRKRKWRQGTFEVSTETVKYLCPAPKEHGHWILPKDEPPRVTKLLMKPALHPISEERWMALERETVDALVVRRRMREKSAIRRLEETEEKEKEENEDVKRKVNLLRVVEQEMRLMVEDDTELAVEEMKIIAKLKKMAKSQVRRKRYSRHALCRQKRSPKRGKNGLTVGAEAESMLHEKQAFREIFPEELQKIKEQAEKSGRDIEYIPSKLVFTKEPGPSGGRKKMRWVVGSNWETRRDDENLSSRADAAALRILVGCSSHHQWGALTLDVRTAFLNAKMIQSEDEPLIVVKPPSLLVEKKYLRRDVDLLVRGASQGMRPFPLPTSRGSTMGS